MYCQSKLLEIVVKRDITIYLLDLCRQRHHSIVDDFFSALVTSGLGVGIVIIVNKITFIRSVPVSGSILGSGKRHGLQIVGGSDDRFHGSDNRLRATTNLIKPNLHWIHWKEYLQFLGNGIKIYTAEAAQCDHFEPDKKRSDNINRLIIIIIDKI